MTNHRTVFFDISPQNNNNNNATKASSPLCARAWRKRERERDRKRERKRETPGSTLLFFENKIAFLTRNKNARRSSTLAFPLVSFVATTPLDARRGRDEGRRWRPRRRRKDERRGVESTQVVGERILGG